MFGWWFQPYKNKTNSQRQKWLQVTGLGLNNVESNYKVQADFNLKSSKKNISLWSPKTSPEASFLLQSVLFGKWSHINWDHLKAHKRSCLITHQIHTIVCRTLSNCPKSILLCCTLCYYPNFDVSYSKRFIGRCTCMDRVLFSVHMTMQWCGILNWKLNMFLGFTFTTCNIAHT